MERDGHARHRHAEGLRGPGDAQPHAGGRRRGRRPRRRRGRGRREAARHLPRLGIGTFRDTISRITDQVVREHDPSGRDVELFRRHHYSAGKGPTVKGLKGAELADGLVIKKGEYKLVKTRFSAFFATHLDSVLKTAGIKNLVIVGVQTPNCIRQTVFDAVALDYEKITVLIDATAAARPEIHLSNIRDMKNIGVETPTLEEWRR
ncbi:hypothetical protein PVAP13_1NG148200 [Panicum virgatum]|uniref:Isochorismatase-like domain-containing protein n=1 Tax=Panicum virgatum TaxID=38727 RepID=A0A8T0WTC4_PANVG|nr:hypothetical protein PVAP13_1NG148200 [Panicum virgatum]